MISIFSCRATLDGRIERTKPVGAHDDCRRKPTVAEAIDAADESVHACPVFMVHLRGLARLGEGVRLIDEQNDGTARLP